MATEEVKTSDDMPHAPSSVTFDQRPYLITGYLRQCTNSYFPQELIQLLYDYYNVIIDWSFEGDDLTKFYECNVNNRLKTQKFTVNCIPFQLSIFPNGTERYYFSVTFAPSPLFVTVINQNSIDTQVM